MRARFLAVVAAGVIAAASAQVPSQAATDDKTDSRTSPLSAQVGKMWQTNGVIWALAHHDGVVYAGGSFGKVRPPGAARGTSELRQARIAAFDADSGRFIKQWRPKISGGDVTALNVSPAGDRLYVGGTFDRVNGKARDNLAAFDIVNPRLPLLTSRPDFAAGVNGKVNDIDSSLGAVYVGGEFTKANGEPRSRVAAFSALDGTVTPFDVQLAGATSPWYSRPFVQAVEEFAGQVYVGGMFERVNGTDQFGLAAVDALSGTSNPSFDVPKIKETSIISDARVVNGQLYVVGRDDHSGGAKDRLEGIMAMNPLTGTVTWGGNYHRCLGDSFALETVQQKMWVGTHAHDCSQVGTFPERQPRFYAAVLGHDLVTGKQAGFYPEVSGSKDVPGSMNNVRALTTDGTNLFAAGGFTKVEGMAQQNIVRFHPQPGSAKPGADRPTATETKSGAVRVSWTTSADPDDRVLDYVVLRGNRAITTFTKDSPFWNRRTVSFTDRDVGSGKDVTYRIRVRDGENAETSGRSKSVSTYSPAILW